MNIKNIGTAPYSFVLPETVTTITVSPNQIISVDDSVGQTLLKTKIKYNFLNMLVDISFIETEEPVTVIKIKLWQKIKNLFRKK